MLTKVVSKLFPYPKYLLRLLGKSQNIVAGSRDSLKPCPHCRRKRRMSPKTATVAEFRFLRQSKSTSRQCGQASPVHTVAENGDSRGIRRQLPFSATVAVFGDKLSPKSATIVSSVDKL